MASLWSMLTSAMRSITEGRQALAVTQESPQYTGPLVPAHFPLDDLEPGPEEEGPSFTGPPQNAGVDVQGLSTVQVFAKVDTSALPTPPEPAYIQLVLFGRIAGQWAPIAMGVMTRANFEAMNGMLLPVKFWLTQLDSYMEYIPFSGATEISAQAYERIAVGVVPKEYAQSDVVKAYVIPHNMEG